MFDLRFSAEKDGLEKSVALLITKNAGWEFLNACRRQKYYSFLKVKIPGNNFAEGAFY